LVEAVGVAVAEEGMERDAVVEKARDVEGGEGEKLHPASTAIKTLATTTKDS
jgi:hypothetical protein